MVCSEQFTCSHFTFNGIERRRFYFPIWKPVPCIVRWLLQGFCSLYTVVFMIISLISNATEHKNAGWFKFLTTWNYILCTTYFLTAFIVNMKNWRQVGTSSSSTIELATNENNTTRNYGSSDVEGGSPTESLDAKNYQTNGAEKFYWLLFSVSHVVCLIVVIIYWGFLVSPDTFEGDSALKNYLRVDRHGILYVLLLLEYMFTDIPVRILHVFYAVTFIFIYIIFNAIYWAITDEVIYSVLDWHNDPGRAVGFIFVFAAVGITLQGILFLIDVGKKKLSNCC